MMPAPMNERGADPTSAADAVRTLVEEAAGELIRAGDARVTLTSIRALYGPDVDYECPVVVLTPRNRSAAELRIEVQDHGVWWLSAGGGPGLEFPDESLDERAALLRELVKAVVRGDYESGVETRTRRALLPPWRREQVRVRVARFFIDDHDPLDVEHWPSQSLEARPVTRFAPYDAGE